MPPTTPRAALNSGHFAVQATEQIVFGVPLADAILAEADRYGAKRVFVTSTRSLARLENGPLQRAEAALGSRHAGTYSNIASHSPREDVIAGANAARAAKADPGPALNGLRGDVLFRTGSFDLEPVMSQQVESLAQALAKSQSLKIRIDGYADPRGSVEDNLKLSEARANAVRDMLLAAGVAEDSLEVNAYGKDQSESGEGDADAYALERRVRLTIEPKEPAPAVAQVGENE